MARGRACWRSDQRYDRRNILWSRGLHVDGYPSIGASPRSLGHMRTILAGELLVSARALDLRQQRPGEGVQHAHNWIRQLVPVLKTDRPPGPDLDVLCAALADESTRRDLLGL